MRNNKTTKKIQRGIALAAITSFLIMPVNLAWSTTITGTTTGGQVNLNGSGDIGYGGVGTGVGHFGQFDITRGDTVNLTGAQRYINMVDQKVNINGTLNALRNGGNGALANTIFIAPDGMVVGANGIMNVAGLQMITPTKTDYNSLVGKGLNNITFDDAKALAGGGNGVLSIDGKIYSAGDVVFSAGGGIFMDDGTLIRTTAGADATENGLGNISMFTNTGSIGLDSYTDNVVIDSAGNLTFNASNGGVGASSGKNALPINVKVAEGKTLNVTVSDEECPNELSRTGVASINNKGTDNLKLGTIKGNHITISNEGTGEMTTTEAITDVTKIYLNAKNGKMNLSHDIEAKDNIRLNGKNQAKTTGNLKVANNGYVSVYSENGDVDIADVTIKQGNVDIKSKKGNVSHGNITISERGKYSDYTRLRDNSKVETFVGAPDTFRTDGVAITANGNITQKAGTKINSAGRVDMVAGGSVNHTVQAADLINVQAGNQAKLATLGTARLGDVSGATVDVTGSDIIIDGKVKGSSKVDINATDKVTIRPRTKLDSTHNTYGTIEATGDINVTAANGITATEQRPEGAMITSTAGSVTLDAKAGDIKTNASDAKITVSAANEANAKGKNIFLRLMHNDGGVGTIAATGDATIVADGDMNVSNKISAQKLTATANNNIKQSASGEAFVSTGDMTLKSNNGNVGMPDGYLTVNVGGALDANAAKGGVYINSNNDLNATNVVAGTDAALKSGKKVTATNITAGNNVTVDAADAVTIANAKSGKNMNLKSKNADVNAKVDVGGELDASGNNVTINTDKDLTIGAIAAANDATITGAKNIKKGSKATSVTTGKNLKITSTGADIGAADKYLTVDVGGTLDADAAKGNVYIESPNGSVTVANANAGKNLAIKAKGDIKQATQKQTTFFSKGDMTLTSTNGNVGIKSDNHENELYVDAKGSLTGIAENGGVYIHNPKAGTDVYIKAKNDVKFDNVEAGRNATIISTAGNVDIINKAEAKNDLTIAADGYIHQATDGQTTFVSGKNMSLTSDSNNVGDPAKYLQVQVGGELDADAPQGGVYIGSKEDLTLGRINAGENAEIIGVKNIKQGSKTPAITTGKNLTIKSETANVGAPDKYLTVKVGNLLDADAPNGGVYIYAKDSNLKVANANAGQDLKIKADGTISQKDQRKTTFFSGKDMELVSTGADVGIKSADHENELYVDAKGSLKGVAENGGVYIHNPKSGKDVYIKAKEDLKFDNVYAPRNATLISTNGNIDIVDQAKADNNLTLDAGGYVHQATPDKVTFVSGKDMTFKSNNDNVGDPNLYLQVDVGGKLDAAAPKGGVYIGSPKDLVVGKVAAGHDVEIVTEGNLHQTPTGGPRPAITAGDSMLLISKTGDVGDPNNWLTVDVGGNGADKSKITAIAANEDEGKDVYIWAKNRPLTIDQVKAGGNIGIGSDTDIIIPHDRDDYNIAAGGDVTLKAGDNILNGGGDKWAIKVGDGHTLDVTANMNEKNDGRIGKLPYTDMRTSLNVDAYVGDINVIKDEVGLTDLIGNIRLKTRPVDPEPDSALSLDDRDHRYSINEDDEPTVNHHRQALRYNVASSDYVLMNSQSDSGAKVQSVVDISKQGMLVKTDTTPQMGENVSITMDYKGLPFTVDGQVVRVNPENNTAGVAFTNVDQLTSSMILYLGMTKGQP